MSILHFSRALPRLLLAGVLFLSVSCQSAQPTAAPLTPAPLATAGTLPTAAAAPAATSAAPNTPGAPQAGAEVPVRLLPLNGPLQAPLAELSGLAWYGDQLILLPQYPERFIQPTAPDSFGAVFVLSKSELRAHLTGQSNQPFNPRPIPLYAPGFKQKVSGYEGFEALAFSGNRVFLTIETHQFSGMLALLIGGEISPDLSQITLDTTRLGEMSAQASIANFSDEAITLVNGQVVTFYEGNGARVTPTPAAHVFDLNLNPLGVILAQTLEYRITDATPADANGRFWVMNYFYPGDTKIAPTSDPLIERYGLPPSHKQSKVVERLVQMQWNAKTISLVPQPPIYLQLLPDGTARNWEGLAQLDDLGFLMVTDSFPSTLFGFLPYP